MLRRRKDPAPIEHRETREEEDSRFTMSLAGLAVALFLMLVGLYVIQGLMAQSRLEDCFLQGRTNCVHVDLTPER
jgi:hypothetical protein